MKKALVVIPLCTLLLLGLSCGLRELSRENAQREWEALMQTLLPGSEHFTEETVEDDTILRVFRGDTGYVLETCTPGYAGNITMAIGISNRGTVTGLQIRDMSETWGLGARAIRDRAFLSQLLNTGGNAQVGENVDSLAGATVTSRAIVRSVNGAVHWVTGVDTDSGATGWGG